jgi:hypothetical protein
MKTLKEIRQAVVTVNLGGGEGGMTLKEASDFLSENGRGFEEVEVVPIKTNFNESKEVTHITNLYVFKKYEEEVVVAAKAKKDAA